MARDSLIIHKLVYAVSFCLLFLAFALVVFYYNSYEKKGPVLLIRLPNNELNLGFGDNGAKTTFEIGIENIGDSELIIKQIASSCSCLKVNVSEKRISPGSDTSITGEYIFPAIGSKDASIGMITNTRGHVTKITIRGANSKKLTIDKRMLAYGVVLKKSRIQKKIVLRSFPEDAGDLIYPISVSSTAKWLETKIVKGASIENGMISYDVLVTLSEEAPLGRFHEAVHISLNNAQMEPITVNVSGDVHNVLAK